MCGRFAQFADWKEVIDLFGCEIPEQLAPRYNITPSQPILTLREGRVLALAFWGLVPSWSKEWPTRPSINARGETVAEKPSFRSAFKRRRCLIPATGYFEWQNQRRGQPKQPFFFRPREGKLLAMGGIWEAWQGRSGEEAETVAIITTEPNKMAAQVHNRMPAIILPKDFDAWLNHEGERVDRAQRLICPAPEEFLEAVAVSKRVNNPKNDDEHCIETKP